MTRQCDWPGCGRDAERDGRCRYHVGRTKPAAAAPRTVPPPANPISHACTVDGCKGRTRNPGDLCSWHRENGTPDQAGAAAAKPGEPAPEPIEKEESVARTCEQPGCDKPTVSDRGRYARVCFDHKQIVTDRYNQSGRSGAAAPHTPEPSALPDLADEDPLDPPAVDGIDRTDESSAQTEPEAAAVAAEAPAFQRATLVTLATEAQDCREMLDEAQRDYRNALARLAEAVSEAAAA